MEKTLSEYKALADNLPEGFEMTESMEEYLSNLYVYYPCAVKVWLDGLNSFKIWKVEGGFELEMGDGKRLVRKTPYFSKIVDKLKEYKNGNKKVS